MKVLVILVAFLACIVGLHAQDGVTDATTDGPPLETTAAPGKDTTEPPKDTTAAPETTAPAETTVTTPAGTESPPGPSEGKWFVEQNNVTCLRMDMRLDFMIEYTKSDNSKANITFTMPGNDKLTKADGNCATGNGDDVDQHEDITLPWGDDYEDWVTYFRFTKPKGDKEYHCDTVTFTFVMDAKHFPDIGAGSADTTTSRYDNATLFKVDQGNSWQCKSNQSVDEFVDDEDAVQRMDTINLQTEAFQGGDELQKDFSDPIPCEADSEVSNIVPIAVGAALAALVVIVLIAYLIGRRRNKRGYESV